jgi:hypothetical protein
MVRSVRGWQKSISVLNVWVKGVVVMLLAPCLRMIFWFCERFCGMACNALALFQMPECRRCDGDRTSRNIQIF